VKVNREPLFPFAFSLSSSARYLLTLIFAFNCSSARVAVTLANRGEDAFKPDVYGDEMTVERTLNKAGGGNYKIKNSDGKTVDTKKATLDAIRSFLSFSLFLLILSQD
jgi:hypothetical protein